MCAQAGPLCVSATKTRAIVRRLPFQRYKTSEKPTRAIQMQKERSQAIFFPTTSAAVAAPIVPTAALCGSCTPFYSNALVYVYFMISQKVKIQKTKKKTQLLEVVLFTFVTAQARAAAGARTGLGNEFFYFTVLHINIKNIRRVSERAYTKQKV